MEIFVTVVETGQITRAAKALNLSKSAISHALSGLEKHLGLQLILRSSRRLQLTEAGQQYYHDCVRILSELTDLEHRISATEREISGHIRLSAPVIYLSNRLTPVIAEFLRQNPAVTIEYVLTEKPVDLLEERIDLAIRIGDLKDSRLIARKVSQTHHILCGAQSYIDAHPPISTPRDLTRVSCLKFIRTPVWHLMKDGKTYRVQAKGNVVSNNGIALREMAVAGNGVAFLPEFLAEPALKDGRLVRLLPDYETRKMDISIVRPPAQHIPARVRWLIDFIIEHFESQP